jgi:hypothetical protein
MRKDVVSIGKRFSRYTVIATAGRNTANQFMYHCVCDCGNKRIVSGYQLVDGLSKSCGCLAAEHRKKANTSHNMTNTKIYQMWAGMKARCYNKKRDGYKNYGGRGIKVCASWKKSFEQFFQDMKNGYSEGLTIDRIDNDGNYCPENCRWVTRKENYLNSSRIKHITIKGVTKPLYEWLSIYGRLRWVYANRVYKYGWTPEKAIITDGTNCV